MRSNKENLPISVRITAIERSDDKEKLVAELWNDVLENESTVSEQGGYVIDPDNHVSFLWRGDPDSAAVSIGTPELKDYFTTTELKNIKGTDFYYLTSNRPLPPDLRAGYMLDSNDSNYDEKTKPLEMPDAPVQKYVPNSKKISDAEKNELMKDSDLTSFPTDPREIGKLQLARMQKEKRFIEFTLPPESGMPGKKFWIHLPENYQPNVEYPLLLLLDGHRQHTIMPIPSVMDNMAREGAMKPAITIYFEEGKDDGPGSERFREFDCNDQITSYLGEKFLPYVRDLLKTDYKVTATNDPGQTTISGFSMSGLAAIYTGLKFPQTFGNVIAQSPSLWKQDEEGSSAQKKFGDALNDFKQDSHLNIYLTSGTLEKGQMKKYPDPKGHTKEEIDATCRSMSQAIKDFQTEVEEKQQGGLTVIASTYMGGHNYCCWQGELSKSLERIYPNPQMQAEVADDQHKETSVNVDTAKKSPEIEASAMTTVNVDTTRAADLGKKSADQEKEENIPSTPRFR